MTSKASYCKTINFRTKYYNALTQQKVFPGAQIGADTYTNKIGRGDISMVKGKESNI